MGIEAFVAEIEQYKQRVPVQLNRFIIAFASRCAEEVVVGGAFGPGTPVDTGYLRAMWYWSMNGGGSSPALARAPGATFAAPTLDAADLLDVVAGDTLELCNNTEYATYVELGTSRMAPRLFVRTVANAANAIAQQVARDLGWTDRAGLQLELAL